ncbi:MAG: 3-deoxy-7-phosphoheptulonate synthase [Candidatus Marinimicrobia bacterium]|nr:3-deoxy-7-phosphoheptulonate synthase [Candidatus Neomarinimicrobiota bacterium]|tara:strand:+ start:7580 stop:8485 length:906 start_codon:yes stop_codon:yes gene_type:complete
MKNNLKVPYLSNKEPTKDITQDDINYKLPKVTSKKEVLVKVSKDIVFSKKTLPIIAGPNGVESRELIFKVAKYLKKIGIKIIRGHAYKPLTFPYRSNQYKESLEVGMDWMDEVKKYLGMSVVTELTEIKHLERVQRTSDILQIGSRNMQNLELLKEAAKTNLPIILKRHFGASLRDMLGAAEHILVEGNSKLILCERGVSSPHTHRITSRFMLDVQAIVALKELVKFPVISDPSHASFWAPWVPSLVYSSIAAGCDGLIIEMHPDPKKSAVDPLQPLNFKKFKEVLVKSKKLSKFFNKNII